MKTTLHVCFAIIGSLLCSVSCGSSTFDKLTEKHIRQWTKQVDKDKLGSFGKITLSKKDFAYYNMDGKVYRFENMENLPLSLREEAFRRELLRREIVRRGYEEGLFAGNEAETYIWPRLEKILEEYYHYKTLKYDEMQIANKLRFSGKNAIEKFYEKNKATFAKEKLSVSDIKTQIAKRVQILTEKEFDEKRLKVIQDLLRQGKMEIVR